MRVRETRPKTWEVINMTPHAINLIGEDGNTFTIAPSGETARLKTERKKVGIVNGFPLTKEIILGHNVPEPKKGRLLLVSRAIVAALSERSDLIAPDTGAAIRSEEGHIVGVPGFAI